MDSIEAIHYFEKLNRLRIERVADLLTAQQQNVLSLIAFLFHTNIEGLPGYINKNTPAGIIDFQVDKACLALSQKLFPNIKYKRRPLRHYPITGLYLVNHHGLFSIPQQAKFSLYLVCAARLNEEQRHNLSRKLSAIAEWTLSQGIKLSTQLLVDDALVSEQDQAVLTAEQLDQFYLNGLVMAGALPFWWLIAPDADYKLTVQNLKQQRIQSSYQFIDFGEPEHVEGQSLLEKISQALADKMESGLDGLLELLYLQQLLRSFPQHHYLCDEYKKHAYQKEYEPLFLDQNVFKLAIITESDLEAEVTHLAQQSFYLQTEEALSKRAPKPRFPWRRRFISEFCQDWQWQPFQFQGLDQRSSAQYQQCLDEHNQTKQLFIDIKVDIQQFCKQHKLTHSAQNKYIDNRLKQINDVATNTIPVLPTGLLAKRPEEHLHLYRFGSNHNWKISAIALTDDEQKPLYQHASLVNVLAWAIANRVLSKATRLMIADKTNTVTISNIVSLSQYLQKMGLVNLAGITDDDLAQAASLKRVFLLANFDQLDKVRTSSNGVQLTSLHNDPFNYANRGETLISSIDVLIQSSHGQWQTFRFLGDTCALEMLRQLMPWWQNTAQAVKAHCWCPSPTYGQLISSRVEKLYKEVCAHFYKHDKADYHIKIADSHYQLLWQPGLTDLIELSPVTDIATYLAKTKQDFYFSKLDAALDPSGLTNKLLSYQSTSHITLFFVLSKRAASIYILDNQGSLMAQHNIKLNETTLLAHYHQFLSAIKPEHTTIRCVSLYQQQDKSWGSKNISLDSTLAQHNYLPVTVEVASAATGDDCIIHCGPKEFSGSENDPKLFQQVSEFLLSLRSTTSHYPLYITGIQFLDSKPVAITEYIDRKQRLEKLLNQD